jgi:ADP-heptose:LPS heptosyltransferase
VGLPVRVDVLQKADRLVFAVVCFLLTVLRRLLPEKTQASEAPCPRSIIFVKLAEQGSTVLASQAIRNASEWVGRENVHFVVFEENRFILDVMGLVPPENVFTVPTTSVAAMMFGTLSALRKIRRKKIDAAIDLEFFARFSAAITWLTGTRWRAGLHTYFSEGPYRGDLFTHRISYNAHIHTSRMFDVMVEALRMPADQLPTFKENVCRFPDSLPFFQPEPGELEKVRSILREKTGGGNWKPLILLNANASDMLPLRRWRIECYQALARRILDEIPGVFVGFTGAPSEAATAEKVAGEIGHPRCFSLAGRTTLRELLVLFTLSDVLVTNDSGPAHFATLTPVHVVTLFGPETPLLFAALTPRNKVLYSHLPCSPCVNAFNNRQTACRDNQCMKTITVEQTFEATVQSLRDHAQSGQS